MLATREIPQTMQLKLRLRGARQVPDLAPRFRLARQMHDCRVSHGAYYPAKILVSYNPAGREELHVIELAHGCSYSRGIAGTRPADFDLLDMLRAIERVAPIHDCALWLERYGTGAEHVRKLMSMLVAHRIDRPWRHLHRAETDTRAAWERLTRPAATRASAAGPRIPPHTPPQ